MNNQLDKNKEENQEKKQDQSLKATTTEKPRRLLQVDPSKTIPLLLE